MWMELERQIPRVGVRWTIVDVSDIGLKPYGFQSGPRGIYSAMPHYAVCVNMVSLPLAVARTGELSCAVKWLQASDVVPKGLRPYIGPEMAEGAAWKFVPVRVFPTLHELSLDNDVIFWALPRPMKNGCVVKKPAHVSWQPTYDPL